MDPLVFASVISFMYDSEAACTGTVLADQSAGVMITLLLAC